MLHCTTVTHVRPLAQIRRPRLLPAFGEVVVRRGQHVTPVQVIARTTQPARYVIVYGSRALKISPEEMAGLLRVKEGDVVEHGQPLLVMQGRLRRRLILKSPIDGAVVQVGNGRIVLQEPGVPIELRALIEGRVVSVLPGQGVVLETTGGQIQGLWDNGRDGTGKLRLAVADPGDRLTADQLNAEYRGAVVAAGHVADTETLEAAEANGVRGLILGSLPTTLRQAVAELSFPVLVTDALGPGAMAAPIFDLLQQSADRNVTLFARLRERPTSRPEIVIPMPAAGGAQDGKPPTEIRAGQNVRLIHAAYQGQVGRVVHTYGLARFTPLGSRVPGADVALGNGQVVFVPYTNLDVIA